MRRACINGSIPANTAKGAKQGISVDTIDATALVGDGTYARRFAIYDAGGVYSKALQAWLFVDKKAAEKAYEALKPSL